MAETRPTGEQISFRSSKTGTHVLDTYMENVEQGTRTLQEMIEDIFDSTGTFRNSNFQFRFDASTDKIQFRIGNFANPSSGWQDLTTFFNITGAFSSSTTYNNFDIVTVANNDVYIVHGLTSGTTFSTESNFTSSSNTEKIVDVSGAQEWAVKTDGIVQSTDYSSKAYAIGGTGVDNGSGSAKDWAIKTSGTVGNTGENSAKYWATSTNVVTVANGIANINTVATDISNVNTVATNITNVNKVGAIDTNVTSVAAIDSNVTTVAGINANVTTVAGVAGNVTTVAGISGNVTTVAGIASNVTTVANNSTDVSTVATNVADLQTVADEIDNNNLQTVAADIAAVVTAANDLNEATSEIDTVANSITNVDAVGGDIANVNTVAGSIANVNTTATNIANVNTVAGISGNVTTVANANSNIATVAGNTTNINTVAGIDSNITTVAGISSNVTTVAGIAADVTTAATNVTAFNNIYLGAQASAPTQDPDGSALDLGDLYFDTASDVLKVRAAGGWINAGSSVNGTSDRYTFTATANQTTFSGTDSSGQTLAYDAGFLDVYMNGIRLAPADFTATNGTSVVLPTGAAAGDTLDMIAFGTFTLQNQSINDMTDVNTTGVVNNSLLAYNSTSGDFEITNAPTVTGLTTTGNINFGDTDKAVFGAGSDLEISHNGNENVIDSNAGTLVLRSAGAGTIEMRDQGSQVLAQFNDNSDVKLYHNNNPKLATTNTGTNTTGISVATDTVGSSFSQFYALGNGNVGGIRFGNTTKTNGYIYYDNGGNMNFYADGSEKFRATSGGTVFNEFSNDIDFRVESNGNTHMLFVDAGNNKVGIAESSPVALMDIGGAQSDQSLMLRSGDNNSASSGGKQILFGFNNSASYSHNIRTRHDSANQTNNTIAFYTWQPTQSAGDYGNARIADFSSSGVVFNEDSRDADFRVESNSNAHAFFVDAGAERIGIFENSPQQGVTLGGGNVFEYRTGSQAMFRPSNNSNDHRIRALSTSGMDVVWGGATNTSMQRWKNGDAVVFNEDSANQDFRVESDSDTHAFFVDAGASRVNMGTSGSLQSASTASNGWTWQGNYMVSCSNADTACILNRTSSVGSIAQFRYNGAGKGGIDISTSGTTYNTTSDIRLKTDIEPIEHATDMLMAMNPVSHRWKADPDADAVVGFIAQEMQEIVPEAVSGDPEGEEMMSMDYGRITPVLVAALQNALNEIETLKQRVLELESK